MKPAGGQPYMPVCRDALEGAMKISRIGVFAIVLVFLFGCSLFIAIPNADAQQSQQFNFPNFNPTPPPTVLQLNGNASIVSGSTANVLQLTPAAITQNGSAWYLNPNSTNNSLPLAPGFTTTFQFQFTNPGSNFGLQSGAGGDGFAFLIQNGSFASGGTGSGPFAVAVTGTGGLLGYTGLTNSVAVQFDTYYNPELGDIPASSGPSTADQISVQSCGAGPNTADHLALNAQGVTCSFGTIDLSTVSAAVPVPIYIADGNVHTATILYVAPTTAGTCLPGSTSSSAGCGTLSVTLDSMTTPVLSVPFSLSYLGITNGGTTLDPNDDAYAGFTASTGGAYQDQDILNWSFSGVFTQPINVNTSGAGPTLTSTFSTSSTGGTVSSTVDYSTAGAGTTNPISNPVFLSINNTLAQTTWPEYVVGTPWATSICTAKSGNGGAGNLCSQYINECFNANLGATTASDANCPAVLNNATYNFANYVTLEDTFDWGTGGKPAIAPGTTASLIAFIVPSGSPGMQWTASLPPATTNPVCSAIPGTATPNCNLSDSLVDMYGDQTTTRGSKPKSKAWLVSVYNVPMLTTSIFAVPNPSNAACNLPAPSVQLNNTTSTVWVNGACLFDFQVNPAATPVPPPGGNNNNFQAAPPATLVYGPGNPPVAPGPVTTGDTLIANPSPNCTGTTNCSPVVWDTQTGANVITQVTGAIPPNSPTLSSLATSGDGTYTMHWSAVDAVGITEKSITLSPAGPGNLCTLPDGSTVSGTQCYYTNYFTAKINIDSTPPAVTGYTFSPTGSPAGTFALNQKVYPSYSCSDNASGLSSCGGVAVSGCPLSTTINSPNPISTSTPGVQSYTVTAVDCALNTSASKTVSYTVASPADVAIIGGATSNTAKSITYVAAALDLTQGTSAYGTVITFQITDSKASVGGPITGVFADVSCSLLGCSELPSGPIACSTSGDTVTCNVGTLPSIFQLKGAVAQITIPVVAKPQANATIGITATVSSDDDPNPKNNSTSVTVSVK
jgi:hypothetical protein